MSHVEQNLINFFTKTEEIKIRLSTLDRKVLQSFIFHDNSNNNNKKKKIFSLRRGKRLKKKIWI